MTLSKDDIMTIDRLKNEERMFLLSLDPMNGQEIAESAGFVPTGKDVRFSETKNVMRSWAKLRVLGVGEQVEQQTEWFVGAMEKMVGHEFPDMFKLQHQATLMTFTIAALQALHRSGLITINDLDAVEIEEVHVNPKTMLPIKAPDNYADTMAEYEVLLQDNRMVAEPAAAWPPPTMGPDPMHDDDPAPAPVEESDDEQ
jgi:hypothetical protein